MSKNSSMVWRVIGVILLLGLLFGGAAAAYRTGYVQGMAQSPAVAATLAEGMKFAPSMHGYYPMWGPHFGFFPFGGFLGFLFFMVLFFGLLRLIFRPHWRHPAHWHGCGPAWGPPPWATGQPNAGDKPQGEAPSEQG